MTPARCRKVNNFGDSSSDDELRFEAPVNGGRNYNGPKVAKFLVGQVPTRTNGVTRWELSQREVR